MPKNDKNLVKAALEYSYAFIERHKDIFVFHDYRFINESAVLCKEIAKGEGLEKDEYENGIVAVILSNLGSVKSKDKETSNNYLVNGFFKLHEVSAADREQILLLIDFLNTNKTPLTPLEKVVRDAKDIHLGLPDALERLSLLQMEEEKLKLLC